jgi:uncharacterized membrane protein HdeD (DUF308 family)
MMATANYLAAAKPGLVGVDELRRKWGWFLALGVVLIVAGSVAIGSSFVMTILSMVFLGWLMIGGGVLEAIHAFGCKKWGGFFIDLLTGLLYIVVGFMFVANPGASAVTLTLLIAMFLIFGGIFRVVIALIMQTHNWGWLLLHGAIDLLLGVLIWRQWPISGLWVIGLFVGIDMICNGWTLVMLGLMAKNMPNRTDDELATTG